MLQEVLGKQGKGGASRCKEHLSLGAIFFQGPQRDAAHVAVCCLDFCCVSVLGCELILLLGTEEILLLPGQHQV